MSTSLAVILCVVFAGLAILVRRSKTELDLTTANLAQLKNAGDELVATNKALRTERDRLREENERLLAEIEDKRRGLDELQRQAELLTASAKNEPPSVLRDKVLAVLGAKNPEQRARALYTAGKIAAQQNDHVRAKSMFTAAVAENPRDAVALTALGLEIARTGETREAEILYRRAIAADPSYVYPFYNLAMLFFVKKDYAQSRDFAQQALRVQPDYAPASQLLSTLDAVSPP